jgi:uncharacterized protein (DUF1684 family)
MTTTADAEAGFEAAWHEWHTEREGYYGDPLGWVSLTGLYWHTDEFETVADLPGRWCADVDAVYVEGVDATVTLDFNWASNLPCAFTDYATCPVAPAENRLSVAVEAGEKNPR